MLYKNIWDLSIALWENKCFQNGNNKCLTYKIEWDILYPTKGTQMKTTHKKNRKGKRAKFKGIKHGVKKITKTSTK